MSNASILGLGDPFDVHNNYKLWHNEMGNGS